MSSIKCPTCGLTNFATAEACKRCKQTLEAPAYPYWQGANAVAPPKPDWSKLQTVPAVPLDPATMAGYGDGCHTVGNILFAIYLGLHLLGMLCALLVMGAAFPEEVWRVVTNPKNTLYLASFEPMYYLGLLGLIIFLPATVVLFLRLLLKSKAFLTWVVIYLLGDFVFTLVQTALILTLSGELRAKHIPQFDQAADSIGFFIPASVISILITFIWFRYFTKSKSARLVFE